MKQPDRPRKNPKDADVDRKPPERESDTDPDQPQREHEGRHRGEGTPPPHETGDQEGESGSSEREPRTDPAEIHRQYLERHLGGGAPATPEAYARAIEQWHLLPGAVRAPATEQGVAKPTSTSTDEAAAPSSDDNQADKEQSS